MIPLLALGAVLFSGHKPPAWLDFSLAGYALQEDDKHPDIAVSDPRTGYFLVRTGECDGAILNVVLTRDRHYVTGEGFTVPSLVAEGQGYEMDRSLTVRRLPSLKTGKGIRIGDIPATVLTKLGKPTRTETSGSRDQFDNLIYEWISGKGELDPTYTETYTFKKGKLIEITFLRVLNNL